MTKPKSKFTDFTMRDRKLISRALGELAASLGMEKRDKRMYSYAINLMSKWDDLPKGTIRLPKERK